MESLCRGDVVVSISGAQTHVAPRDRDVALAVAKIPSDENVDQLLSTANIEGMLDRFAQSMFLTLHPGTVCHNAHP